MEHGSIVSAPLAVEGECGSVERLVTEGYSLADHESLVRREFKGAVAGGWDSAAKPEGGNIKQAPVQNNQSKQVLEELEIEEHENLHAAETKVLNVLGFKWRNAKSDKVVVLRELVQKMKGNNFLITMNSAEDNMEDADDKEEDFHQDLYAAGVSEMIERARLRSYVWRIAAAVASMTTIVLDYVDWKTLDKKFSNSPVYKDFRVSLLRSTNNFVLNLIELEDLERLAYEDKLHYECQAFLCSLWNQRLGENPLAAIAKSINERTTNLDKFFFLREQDVGYVFMQYLAWLDRGSFEVAAKVVEVNHIKLEDVRKCHVREALKAMEEYVPLREDCRGHLNLELRRKGCHCVLENLLLECWKGIKILELKKLLPEGDEPSDILENLACELHSGFCELMGVKAWLLENSADDSTFPLAYGTFGPCTDGVLEVVKHADHLRRIRGHQFIGMHDLLTGISQMGVPRSVSRILDDILAKNTNNKAFESPIYDIYQSARDIASSLGDDKMGVEHLFLATIFRKQGTNQLKEVFRISTVTISNERMWHAVVRKKEVRKLLACMKKSAKTAKEVGGSLKRMSDVWRFLPNWCFADKTRKRVTCTSLTVVSVLKKALEDGRVNFCSRLR